MRRKFIRIAVPVMECIATMPGTVTLTPHGEAGIEENTYLAYVFCDAGPLRSCGAFVDSRQPALYVGCQQQLGFSVDLVQVNCACSLVWVRRCLGIWWPG